MKNVRSTSTRHVPARISAEWESRLADLWASIDDCAQVEFLARMEALVGELASGSAVAAFERASSLDSTGHSDLAISFYGEALELGLTGERRRRAVIQLASSLRSEFVSPSLPLSHQQCDALRCPADDEAVTAFLALALVDVGREREAVSLALSALARHLPEVSTLARKLRPTDLRTGWPPHLNER